MPNCKRGKVDRRLDAASASTPDVSSQAAAALHNFGRRAVVASTYLRRATLLAAGGARSAWGC
ncbi:MAG: hypothetical protein AB7U73_24320 [Pirellulales bacterium]